MNDDEAGRPLPPDPPHFEPLPEPPDFPAVVPVAAAAQFFKLTERTLRNYLAARRRGLRAVRTPTGRVIGVERVSLLVFYYNRHLPATGSKGLPLDHCRRCSILTPGGRLCCDCLAAILGLPYWHRRPDLKGIR